MGELLTYIRSFRLQQLPVVLSALFFGVFASSHALLPLDYLVLTPLSFSGHLFGYGLNDLMDFRYDKTNPKHRYSISLVSKGFDKKWYLAVALIQLPLIVLTGYLVYGESIIYVGLALVSLTLYNLLNKRPGCLAGLTHLLFPLALVLLCMGGYTLFDSITEMDLTFILLLLSLFFNTILANGICGGLKDLKSDQLAGAGSLAIFLKSTYSDKTVQISKLTRVDAYTGSAFLFYATPLAWIPELPLLYPFAVRREGHFGLSTLTSFFNKPQMDQKL